VGLRFSVHYIEVYDGASLWRTTLIGYTGAGGPLLRIRPADTRCLVGSFEQRDTTWF
jgi:hypothetical protein